MTETGFEALYQILMKEKFLTPAVPAFGEKPATHKVEGLIATGEVHLPNPFRAGYADPLRQRLDGLFARLMSSPQPDLDMLETLAGAVYQQGAAPDERVKLHRFLAVISNFYRSFLDSTKREHLRVPLTETLPPLAVFQSDPAQGPFTVTAETTAMLIGSRVGVVSMPHTFAGHPLLYGSLAHETGGHDVIHADVKLMPQLRAKVHALFQGRPNSWLGLLWDYWMDETAADVYGVLNIGPTFGPSLAMLLAVFIGQAMKRPPQEPPRLRTSSGAGEDGALDPHPTDILRLAVIEGVIDKLTKLSQTTRAGYIEQLNALARLLAPTASTVELAGLARVRNGQSMDFQHSVQLDVMQAAAREVGGMIATEPLEALDGRPIQDIETWDDSDESTAAAIGARLQAGGSIVSAGDDAQIIAGLTLACLQQPQKYDSLSRLADSALDDSFRNDPYWGVPVRDKMVIKPTRSVRAPEVVIDPFLKDIIDYNPLDDEEASPLGTTAAMITQHQIRPIEWSGHMPKRDAGFHYKGTDAELPEADYVLVTWTAAEANAMSAVLTPGSWAMPARRTSASGEGWYVYANQFKQKYAGRFTHTSPAATEPYLGKFMPILIGNGRHPKRVLCFKSNLHLGRDDKSMPVKDLFKQVIAQTKAKLVITTGTAGAIGKRLRLGDVVVANRARFDCQGTFKGEPFNGKTYSSGYEISASGSIKTVNTSLIRVNAGQLPASSRAPQVFTSSVDVGEPAVIVTTDIFAFDDAGDHYGLQGLGAMVEMDDAVLGLACQEIGAGAPKWVAVRNASDPQMPTATTPDKRKASDIYMRYGYWTTIPSVLACWALVNDA